MFGAQNSPLLSASRYQPHQRASLSEKMGRFSKLLDLGLLWGSYALIVAAQFVLDARRLKPDADSDSPTRTGMPLIGEMLWKKLIEWATSPTAFPQISKLPPMLVASFTVTSFALFSLNSMRVIAVKSSQCAIGSQKMAVSILLTLVSGILMTSDIVDYLILIVPLSVAVGITAALSSSKYDKKGKDKKDLDSGYESEEYEFEDRWMQRGKKVDYNFV